MTTPHDVTFGNTLLLKTSRRLVVKNSNQIKTTS